VTRLATIPFILSAGALAADAAGGEIHGEGTAITLGLAIASLGAAVTVAWKARGERDEVKEELRRLRWWINRLPCVVDAKAKDRMDLRRCRDDVPLPDDDDDNGG
jgi:hypothetical protein